MEKAIQRIKQTVGMLRPCIGAWWLDGDMKESGRKQGGPRAWRWGAFEGGTNKGLQTGP
jgi:hypothetical protein